MNNGQTYNPEQQNYVEIPKENPRFKRLGKAITAAFVGSLSIWFGSFPGFILSIVAMNMSKKVLKYTANEHEYIFAKIGKLTGIAGLIISIIDILVIIAVVVLYALYIVLYILAYLFLGLAMTGMFI